MRLLLAFAHWTITIIPCEDTTEADMRQAWNEIRAGLLDGDRLELSGDGGTPIAVAYGRDR